MLKSTAPKQAPPRTGLLDMNPGTQPPPLRIAMVVPPWYEVPPPGYGGIEQVCAALTDALVARGHDVTLFGVGRGRTSAQFVNTIGEPQYERLGQALPELIHASRVNRLIDPDRFDIVHDHTMAGLLGATGRQVPTVTTVHGSPEGELGSYLDNVDRSVGLIAISHSQRRLRAKLPWLATIHHGLPAADAVRSAPGSGPVVWLARFTPDKGADLAIKACREAGLPLVLAGKCNEASERQYLDEVVTPMLDRDVEIVVNPDRARCQELLWQARCLLLPIRWEEPFGVVLLEAMSVGTPVVTLNRGAVPEVVLNGRSGFVCTDPAQLPQALTDVVSLDPADCAEHARVSFSADLMASRYERVYRKWAIMRLLSGARRHL
jgi:glycosyltransferase involved in cell wall biosynthesis